MKSLSFALVAVAAVALATPAGAATVVGVDVADSQITPNHSTGTSKAIPLYAFIKDESTVFTFNSHYSQMPIKWTLDVPTELEGTNYVITSASVTLYQQANEGFWDPTAGDLKLFKTAFSGDTGETAASWTEAKGYYGPGAASATPLQDPYLSELGTGDRAEDDLTATAWAVGEVDSSYDGSTIPTEAVPIRFYFDVNDSEIRQYLHDGLDAGFIMFTVASTHAASQPGSGGGDPVDYPRIVTKEGVGDPAYGTIQKAPTLTIEISGQASARDWNLY